MRNDKGQFVKGHRASPDTEFKQGQHWREPKPYWQREWLKREYWDRQRSASEIAGDFGITENAILYWLDKLHVPRRSVSEARAIKHWGAIGEDNPMYGITGPDNPNWKGGVTPERQALYSSIEWRAIEAEARARACGICHRCGAKEPSNAKRRFHLHHIEGFQDAPEKRCDLDNLELLCPKCHAAAHRKEVQ